MKHSTRTLSPWAALLPLLWLSSACQAQTSVQQAAATAAAQPGITTPAVRHPGYFSALGAPLSKCQSCWHHSTLRKLLKNGMAPLNAATGGLIGGGHDQPPPPPAGAPPAPPPPPPAVNAAAKIKVEAAQAQGRVEAVRYLGTVDCHWYPEAEAGLIASLRADRSECVRLAAAQALTRACCCTKKTMAALQISAAGSNVDGNPGERCPRVRWAALHALQICLQQCDATHFQQPSHEDRPESPEDPLASSSPANSLPEFYRRLDAIEPQRLIHEAQRTVSLLAQQQPQPVATPRRGEGLAGIWAASGSRARAPANEPIEAEAIATKPTLGQQPIATNQGGYPLARPLEPRAASGRVGDVQPVSASAAGNGSGYENFRR